ncbi:MAG: META domain-containing protein [Cytophagales bacterium]|nr:META domain-containing protein [Cytophagales bacterium]
MLSKIILALSLLLIYNMPACEKETIDQLQGEWTLSKVFLSDAYDSPCGWEAGEHKPLTLILSKKGDSYEFNGQSAVNTYFGSLKVLKFQIGDQTGKVEVGLIGATKMAGPEPLMNCETRFFNFLESANHFSLNDDGTLSIGNFRTAESHPRDGGSYLVFEKMN